MIFNSVTWTHSERLKNVALGSSLGLLVWVLFSVMIMLLYVVVIFLWLYVHASQQCNLKTV